MRWRNARKSSNVEHRGRSTGTGRRRVGARAASGGSIFLVIGVVLVSQFLGVDLTKLLGSSGLNQQSAGYSEASSSSTQIDQNSENSQFVAAVLGSTEDIWAAQFARQLQKRYREPVLVNYQQNTSTACGAGQAAMGPFYCPADQKVYLDMSFFEELSRKYGAPGDFAAAYVIAHEVGHHIQTVMGISAKVHQQRQRASQNEANRLSVKQELQADCFAGVWAHYADSEYQLLEVGDIEEGMQAAQAVGDDTLQRKARGRVVPESFTHGSSAQRERWFLTGYRSGAMNDCNTFSPSVTL